MSRRPADATSPPESSISTPDAAPLDESLAADANDLEEVGSERYGKLFVVGTPIGNMEDITLRALRILSTVRVIAAEDTRAAQHLLQHHHLRASSGSAEIISFFSGNEAQRTPRLLAMLKAGRDVALISEAGLPGISDPGQRLVAAAREAAVPVEVVPGPSASLTALIGSGLRSERFLFVGFPPRTEGARLALFGSLRSEPGTLIFYESPERTHRTLLDLAAALGGHRPACVARELTKLYEEHARGTLTELAQRYSTTAPRGEITLVVAGTAEAAAADSDGQSSESGAAPAFAGSAPALDLETEIHHRLQTGQGPKEIATALTLLTGQPRRKLYQLALLHKERMV